MESVEKALAATTGTGNIVGVATAVSTGGPGGMMAGGPMCVLERGVNARWLGVIFSVPTAFGIGNEACWGTSVRREQTG